MNFPKFPVSSLFFPIERAPASSPKLVGKNTGFWYIFANVQFLCVVVNMNTSMCFDNQKHEHFDAFLIIIIQKHNMMW